MRVVLAVATAALLGGCQVVGFIFPNQTLTLINQTSVSVKVRVGEFKSGDMLFIETARSLQRATIAAGKKTTMKFPTGRYSVYAEAETERGEAALTDIQLNGTREGTLVLNEKVEDRAGNDKASGSFFRQLGWIEE